MPNNLSDTTISITSVIQFLSPVAVAVIGGASWVIKRTIGKFETGLEKVQEDVDELDDRCQKAEKKIREEREAHGKSVSESFAELRKDCERCKEKRIQEREDCVDTYGKFGARLTELETEHRMHHRGELCHPK